MDCSQREQTVNKCSPEAVLRMPDQLDRSLYRSDRARIFEKAV